MLCCSMTGNVQLIETLAELIESDDRLYPIRILGVRADARLASAVLAALASVLAALGRLRAANKAAGGGA